MEPLLDGFGLTRFGVGLLLPAVYASGLLFALAAGRAADRWGPRVTLLAGLLLAAVALVVGAGAPSYALFLACLFAAGSGWSIANPALGKAIIEIFPPSERGVAMGIKQMGLTLGGVASALALPPIAGRWGFRAAMVVCAVVAIAPLLASWRPLGRLPQPAAIVARAADHAVFFSYARLYPRSRMEDLLAWRGLFGGASWAWASSGRRPGSGSVQIRQRMQQRPRKSWNQSWP